MYMTKHKVGLSSTAELLTNTAREARRHPRLQLFCSFPNMPYGDVLVALFDICHSLCPSIIAVVLL